MRSCRWSAAADVAGYCPRAAPDQLRLYSALLTFEPPDPKECCGSRVSPPDGLLRSLRALPRAASLSLSHFEPVRVDSNRDRRQRLATCHAFIPAFGRNPERVGRLSEARHASGEALHTSKASVGPTARCRSMVNCADTGDRVPCAEPGAQARRSWGQRLHFIISCHRKLCSRVSICARWPLSAPPPLRRCGNWSLQFR
jgi:hypothetical protein